ncbi:hypothetical protein IIV31_064L [Armadillidium vulgare iridescent virus]|uniref:Uncharacterized protein n=1 Tax=Armadillidium vulgare iridescent virus TaxID=72201 RepID=A0A068QKE4_9VIRU|nr:hypothetical protein IIV31_064L [Armadillidium vulgare iridescent virus]CCV02436.1 hypothetical protein IIV31_064L [Armadillidium vulgare iridescent virus]
MNSNFENEETINIEEGDQTSISPIPTCDSFEKKDEEDKEEEYHKTTEVDRKIEPSTQFGDLKTKKHSTKMTLIESFTDMINNEILRFATQINELYPEVPVDGLLAIWCKQQNLPASTFNLDENLCDTDVDEPPKVEKKKKSPKTKKIAPLSPPPSDAEDDVPSEDEEPEHGKKKKPVKKEKKEKVADTLKVCQHRFVKGKNANTQCTIKVKGEGDFCSKHKEKKAK